MRLSLQKFTHLKLERGTVINFIINYCIMGILVSIAFFPLYSVTVKSIEENVYMEYQKLLTERLMQFENDLTILKSVSTSLRSNYYFMLLSRAKGGDLKPSEFYYMTRAQAFFRDILVPLETVQECYFVFKKNDILISRKHVISEYQAMYNELFKYDQLSWHEWKDIITGFFKQNRFLNSIVYVDLTTHISTNVIPYIIPAKNSLTDQYDSALVCMFDSEKLERMLFGSVDTYEIAYIEQESGERIFFSNSAKLISNIDHRDSELITVESKTSGLKTVIALPKNVFSIKIQKVINNLKTFFMVSLIFSIIVAFILAQRNQRQFKWMQLQYSDKIDNLERSIKLNLFDKLLNNYPLAKEDNEKAHEYFSFLEHPYVIAIIGFFNKNDRVQHVLNVMCEELVRDNLKEAEFIHTVFIKQLIVVIRIDECDFDKLRNTLNSILKYFRSKAGVSASVAVSSKGVGLEDISKCYTQAHNLLRVLMADEENTVAFYCDSQGLANYVDISTIQKLHEMLISGDKEQALKIIDSVYEKIVSNKYVMGKTLERVFYTLQNIILLAAESIGEYAFIKSCEYKADENVIAMFKNLKISATDVCDEVQMRKKSNNSRILREFREYLSQNFDDPMLSVSLISEKLGVSEKYLSNYIKEQTGKNPSQHIEEIRLAKARQLLLETNITINDIALNCGFASQNSFYKAFRRIMGVSPGVWRESHKEFVNK